MRKRSLPANLTRLSVALFALFVTALLVLGGADTKKVNQERLAHYRNLAKAFYENPTTRAKAVEVFHKAVEMNPDSPTDRLNYGLALLRVEKIDQGIAELEKVQHSDPALPHTWFNLGIAYKRKGKFQEAIRQFEQMVKLVPDEPISHYNLGLLYRYTNRVEDSLKQMEIASKLDPNFIAPLFQIFDIYRSEGHAEKAVDALKRFRHLKQLRKGADNEDTDWSYYSEIYDEIDPKRAVEQAPPVPYRFRDTLLAGEAAPSTAGAVVLDATADGVPDLLVWSLRGMNLYHHGATVAETGLENLKEILSVTPADFDNDGFTDLCIVTRAGAALYRNREGKRFQKQESGETPGAFRQAVWLDYDHDNDLDLFLLGSKCVLLRNQGVAGFVDHTQSFPFAAGHVIDGAAFRVVPDSKAMDLVISYQEHSAVLYRDRLLGAYEAIPIEGVPAGATAIIPYDVDNNSWIDLAFVSGSKVHCLGNRRGKFETAAKEISAGGAFTFADLSNHAKGDLVTGNRLHRNLGLTHFASGVTPKNFPRGVVWVEADFDHNGLTDLATVSEDGHIHLLKNITATKNHWLGVTLSGLKNLKLGWGSEVEVKAATCYQKKAYEGVPLLFGLRSHDSVDTVRVTWSNGLMQNETFPVPVRWCGRGTGGSSSLWPTCSGRRCWG